jgi:hypothetical protein
MPDKELGEIIDRWGWSAGQPIPRGMLLETMLPALNALFGLEYEDKNK